MRVYLPSTLGELSAAMGAGGYGSPPILAFAVTPTLRESYASADAEDLEYAAMTDAARESLRRLGAEPSAPPRRVVVAADIPDAHARWAPQLHPAAVHIDVTVPLHAFASVHVDDASAEGDVKAAVAAMRSGDSLDLDAAFTLAAVEDHELLWYATQEVPDLLRH